jgi:hypothetical protein
MFQSLIVTAGIAVISLQFNNSDLGIMIPQKMKRVVSRCIIGNDEFQTGVSTCQHRRKELFKVFTTVKIDNDNRYFSQPDMNLGIEKRSAKNKALGRKR